MDGAVAAASNYSGDAYFYYYDYQQSVSYNNIFGNGEVKGMILDLALFLGKNMDYQ